MNVTITILNIIYRLVFCLKTRRFGDWTQSPFQVELTQSLVTSSSSIYWVQLTRFHLKTKTETALQNVLSQIKDRTMDNVHNRDSYFKICFVLIMFRKMFRILVVI
jgi:hypothetical protein